MSKKNLEESISAELESLGVAVDKKDSKPKCFIIMPLADVAPYDPGHFERVYSEIIQPACEQAGFVAETAAVSRESHQIVTHILRSIVSYDMALCDLSSANANVFYELGIRQMAKMPVAIIKDDITVDKFDVRGFRYQSYSSSLRSDLVKKEVAVISQALQDTYSNREKITAEFLESLSVSLQIEPKTLIISEAESILNEKLDLIMSRLEKDRESLKRYIIPNKNGLMGVDGKQIRAGDFFSIEFGNEYDIPTSVSSNIFYLVKEDSNLETAYLFSIDYNEGIIYSKIREKIHHKTLGLRKLERPYVQTNFPHVFDVIRRDVEDAGYHFR